jgi:nitrate reductase gamma subunit
MMLIERLHLYSLAFMAAVYVVRIVWIMRFRLARDLARPKGDSLRGAALAMTTMFRPWSMETTRTGFIQWVEFAVFHVGVAVMIAMSFVISLAQQWLTPTVIALVIASQALALVAGILRLVKRLREPRLRAISSPDDYFALAMANLLFITCALATLHLPAATELYFILVAIIIAIVPFTKISHYIYYPFARYFYGSYLGRRGVAQ